MTIAEAFADIAARYPDQPAVLFDDQRISYAELSGTAGAIATLLTHVRPALAPASRVGLLFDHGADMIAAILGTAAAGCCYVPLDPTYPPERLQVMAAQGGLSVVLTRRRLGDLAATVVGDASALLIDDLAADTLTVAQVDPGQPAYILFTSGSTGVPKGVTHSHRSVLHGIANHITNLELGVGDRLSLVTSFSYDMSVSDLYGAILSGGAVVPVDLRSRGLPELAEQMSRHRVSIYHSTPTVFRYLVDYLIDIGGPAHRLPDVRVVLLGGEPAHREDLRLTRTHFASDCRLVNGYGATEASFTVQLHLPVGTSPPGDDREQVLPIGRPLAGYEVVLLDEQGAPLPAGARGPGELAVRSDYLSLGYWADPQRTAERFAEQGRLYRTGDVARWLDDGNLAYLGREDRQVKVNGHRVELGEIEAHVNALPQVARAAARTHTGPDGTTQVHVYVQPSRGTEPDSAQLRQQLAARLPAYLLPHRLIVLAELPLTTSGKVDVRALPAPDLPAPGVRDRAAGEHSADQGDARDDATEALVTRAWCEVLGLGSVGREVSFFDAGGTSLSLTRLQYRLTRLTGVEVPLVRLLEHPTVAAMARHIAGDQVEAPLQRAADRMARRRASRQRAASRPVPSPRATPPSEQSQTAAASEG